MSETFRRRSGPRDIALERAGKERDPEPGITAEAAKADRDYFGNLKKFTERPDDQRAAPTRNKGSDYKPHG